MYVKNRFKSLISKLLFTMMGAIVISLCIFAVVRETGNFLVWRYYLDDQEKHERAESYVEDLNEYIHENKLSVDDSEKISLWSKGKYVDVILYKDESLIYAPDWFEHGESGEDGELETDRSEDFFYNNDSWFSGDRGFEQYLTEEAREKYQSSLRSILENNEELYAVYCIDGTLLAAVVDYSEDLMYNIVFVVSIVLALVVIAVIMAWSLTKLSARVTRLAQKVKAVEEGRHDMPIVLDGEDEIASLASDVNSMRNTIVDSMTKERRAWEANSELIVAMSHDIRTPLTVLLGYLDLIKVQNADTANQEYINICKENALRLKNLSDDMFSYFLVFGKNDKDLNMSQSLAADTVGNMIEEYGTLLSEQGYKISYEGQLDGILISVDTAYFVRVIGNIFSNVKKYADREKAVLIKTGFDGKELSIVFENRISQTENIRESTGIGLKTCQKIMQQMGGEFNYDSKDGVFTSSITVPAKKSEG